MRSSLSSLYKRTSIKKKWTWFVLILVLYPMILIGYVGYKNYEEVITEHFNKSVQKDVLVVSEWFEERLGDLEKFIAETQYHKDLYEYATYYYGRMKMAGIDIKEQTPKIAKQIDQLLMNDYNLNKKLGNYLMSLLLTRQDVRLAAFQFKEQEEFHYIEFRDKGSAFYEHLEFKSQGIFENIEKEFEKIPKETMAYYIDDLNNIYLAQKIFYRDTLEEVGTIVLKLDMQYLLQKYEQMLTGAIKAVYVEANKSDELLALGELSQEEKSKLVDFMNRNPEQDIVYKEESKKQAIMYNTFSTRNLVIGNAIYISTDILLQDIRSLSRFIFMLCISILPIFLFLANKLYKEIIYPVYVLSDKMQQIEKGEIGVQIKGDYHAEIGYVYGVFNRMSKQIQYLVNCVYREQLMLKSSELKVLQDQINPHFLYNTLEMINWKARMSGDEEIAQMIEALAGIMEVNIDRRDSHFLTIKEEVEYLKNYIFLIQKRFGERIQFETQASESVLDYKIPRLILQPLVENAITHGIEPRGEGKIIVRAEECKGLLYLTVEDTGEGINEERLHYLQKELNHPQKNYINSESQDEGISRQHIGIINVQKRIKLLYGEEYGMHIQSIEGEGTQITIKLFKEIRE